MAWTIKISRTAEKEIQSLDTRVQRQLLNFFRSRINLTNPRQSGKLLKGHKKDLWHYRLGDYRIICDLQDKSKEILILAIGHRSKVYKSQ